MVEEEQKGIRTEQREDEKENNSKKHSILFYNLMENLRHIERQEAMKKGEVIGEKILALQAEINIRIKFGEFGTAFDEMQRRMRMYIQELEMIRT